MAVAAVPVPTVALCAPSPKRRQARRDGVRTKAAPAGRVTLLSGVLQLGDVESVESLARRVLDERLRASGAYLNPTEYEDALSYMVAEAWVLYRRFDPAKGTQSFSTYAYRILWRRVASWYRQRFGDTRYRVKPTWVSLDDNDLDEIAAGWEWEEPEQSDRPLYQRINVDRLSPEGRMTFERIAEPMVEHDLTLEQIAKRIGWKRRHVSRALQRLREELAPMIEERS